MSVRIRQLGAYAYGASDTFYLDTNVILFLHHPPSFNSSKIKAAAYSNFVGRLKKAGCNLCVSSLNVQEAFHAIETIAYNKHKSLSGLRTTRKEYRRRYRCFVLNQVQSLWVQLKENYSIMETSVTIDMLNSFIGGYEKHYYDPVDFLFTKNHLGCNVITDDGDFSADPIITMFTY